jgi:hypothetical protein
MTDAATQETQVTQVPQATKYRLCWKFKHSEESGCGKCQDKRESLDGLCAKLNSKYRYISHWVEEVKP